MFRSCKYCGRIVEEHHICANKPIRKKYQREDAKIVKFRKTRQWIKKSKDIRDRDNNMCQYCINEENRITYKMIEVHHIVAIKDDWSRRLDNYNLISLCRMHHEMAEDGTIKKEKLFELAREREKSIPPLEI